MTITSRKSKKYGLGYEGFSSNLLHQNNYFKNFTVPGSFFLFFVYNVHKRTFRQIKTNLTGEFIKYFVEFFNKSNFRKTMLYIPFKIVKNNIDKYSPRFKCVNTPC